MPDSASITIRRAVPADLPHYVDLVQRVSAATYPDPSLGFGRELFSSAAYHSAPLLPLLAQRLSAHSPVQVWLALDGNRLVGTIALHPDGATSELLGFYVAPEYQGQGIGHRLWQTLLAANAGRGLWLTTYMHCHRALAIYKHYGFRLDPERPPFVSQWPGLAPGHGVRGVYLVRRP